MIRPSISNLCRGEALATALWAVASLWPLSDSGLGMTAFIAITYSGLALLLTWFVLLIARMRKRQSWGSPVPWLTPPLLSAVIVVLMMLPPASNPLFRARFLASRASLAEVADSIHLTPITDGQRVGLFVVRRATFDEGRLRLVTSYCGLVDECGIVYSPHPLPSRLAGDRLTRLGGPWYHLYFRF
jgi:hypothetical protein